MAPTIHNPADLTPEKRLAIERKQFDQVLPHMHYQYVEWQLECDYIFGDSPDGVRRETFDLNFTVRDSQETIWKTVEGYPIVEYEWASLITSDYAKPREARMTMHPNMIDAYITMVCKYANRVRGDAKRLALEQSKAGKKLDRMEDGNQRARSRSPPRTETKPIRVRSPVRGESREEGSSTAEEDDTRDISPSCKILSGTALFNCFTDIDEPFQTNPEELDEKALDQVLDNIDLTQQNFRELDYLFIPIVDQGYAHAILVGLAPRQKYAFFLDSSDQFEQTRWWSAGLMAIIHKLDPTIKFTDLNKPVIDRTKYWYLFGQYPQRSKTTDSSPDGPQQSDAANCGIFSLTSAFCLAFGYNLLCWEQSLKPGRRQDLDKWKKARVLWELELEDFSAENDFEYDLLEIPQDEIKPFLRPNNDPVSEASASDSASIHPYEDLTPGEEEDEYEHDPMDEGEVDYYDDNMDEAFGIKQSEIELGYITDEGEEGSDGEVDDLNEADTGRAFFTLNHFHAPWRETEPIYHDLPWPAQISEEPKGYFQRSGFIYPAPEVNFQPELQYSKRELKKACRNFPLYGWKRWSRQSQPLFLQWMLNEMAARISTAHEDPIEPMDHLARQDPKWRNLHCETFGIFLVTNSNGHNLCSEKRGKSRCRKTIDPKP
ncbi:hypothetical protein VTL71DRAFT_12012 [Oculimacula yallundae]|uniref:Ubiquitin-like protease family profile domain-containing protein n=1 Tax=Oculimacula yallundae TaxID=86028 RepID=A0ABR4CRQ4_9HELO